jgi:hypothetical protein
MRRFPAYTLRTLLDEDAELLQLLAIAEAGGLNLEGGPDGG